MLGIEWFSIVGILAVALQSGVDEHRLLCTDLPRVPMRAAADVVLLYRLESGKGAREAAAVLSARSHRRELEEVRVQARDPDRVLVRIPGDGLGPVDRAKELFARQGKLELGILAEDSDGVDVEASRRALAGALVLKLDSARDRWRASYQAYAGAWPQGSIVPESWEILEASDLLGLEPAPSDGATWRFRWLPSLERVRHPTAAWRYDLIRVDQEAGGELGFAVGKPAACYGGSDSGRMELEIEEARADELSAFTKANVGRRVAVILDGRVLITPVLQSELTSAISLQVGPWAEASLCEVLAAGPLPSPISLEVEDLDSLRVPTDSLLLRPDAKEWQEKAPETFRARFFTTRGPFVVDVRRADAPLGADRFYNLVRHGFYDGARFFRVIDGFVAQLGINPDPGVSKVWAEEKIEDDPVMQSNTRGWISFATDGPDTRTTQIYVNYGDNSRLDARGFSPFGKVIEGMENIDRFHSGYGDSPDSPRGGKGPLQSKIESEGNRYLVDEFEDLDFVIRAQIE